MELLSFLAVSGAVLLAAYFTIGKGLASLFRLSDTAVTPAHQMRDGLDYEPIKTNSLLPQHFSAIAAAGPIVGPILAGVYFGWGPAWIWIIVGSILIGGIHDFTALVASVRHQAKSVAEIVRQYMNPRAYILFLLFIWSALVYVIIAFTDVTALTFLEKASTPDGQAPGPAVATSSILYLLLAVVMGVSQRFLRLGPIAAKLIFLPLVVGAILVGPSAPLDLSIWFPALQDPVYLQRTWGFILLGYCLVAALSPVWALLQPRGELGGYFLYAVMILAVTGIVAGTITGTLHIEQPFFKGWNAPDKSGAFGATMPIVPILFITVACGACSGFHSIVASGTTSKQLNRETDAKPIAYGGMLLEGFFACISLATLMVLSKSAGMDKGPNFIYATGIADFGERALHPLLPAGEGARTMLFQFALLCFATFVFDTLDACTRLARYILMELLGWTRRSQAVIATMICLIIPVIAISLPRIVLDGKPQPLWRIFWNIFGSSNQLLAALTLLGVTVWMARRAMNYWIALVPTMFMMAMSLWSLVLMVKPYLIRIQGPEKVETIRHFQFGIVVTLIGLSIWLIIEALITWKSISSGKSGSVEGLGAVNA